VDDDEDEKDEEEEDVPLDFDSYIDRILQRTRALALFNICSNTDTVEEKPESIIDSEYESEFESDVANEDVVVDDDSPPQEEKLRKESQVPVELQLQQPNGSSETLGLPLSRTKSQKSSEKLAETRLVRTLCAFLNLPRCITYQDLELVRMYCTTVLNETKLIDMYTRMKYIYHRLQINY
jgi:hypothetical protein